MRRTFIRWRAASTAPMYTVQSRPRSAHAVAVATPCWPAPVSQRMRFFPVRFASRHCPSVLLSLCAPVWRRSSRFSVISHPARSERRWARESGVGRPA